MAALDLAEAEAPAVSANNTNMRTLAMIDDEYEQIGCLGRGSFGSVFLAKKESGRKVALKFMLFNDPNDDNNLQSFHRELNAVAKLNSKQQTGDDTTKNNKDLSIIFFEEWFMGNHPCSFACIVMNYCDGGTLSALIEHKYTKAEAFSERRIGWYALQLSEALAYAHERGVAHHDVKSANVLIDGSGGGKLLLADFGGAVEPGEECSAFTEIYASPELLQAHEKENYMGLRSDLVDSFGLGCILFELVCCRKMVDLTTGDKMLAEVIYESGHVDAALDLPCIRLPWLPQGFDSTTLTVQAVGYSDALRCLLKTLLDPSVSSRLTPSDLQIPLRQDPVSPLLANYNVAAEPAIPGTLVSVDNVQRGMFVQRGPDWDDGDIDGGVGSIGVVIKLDPDAGYTEVIWPSRSLPSVIEPFICRIGASGKFELQVAPTQSERSGGALRTRDTSKYVIGQAFDNTYMVVGIRQAEQLIFVAPTKQLIHPTLPRPSVAPQSVAPTILLPPQPPPETWQTHSSMLVEVVDMQERKNVMASLQSARGGIQPSEIVSLMRVQSPDHWEVYSRIREEVAASNWGMANEQRLFLALGSDSPEAVIQSSRSETAQLYFSKEVTLAMRNGHTNAAGSKQIVLFRVILGKLRALPGADDDSTQPPHINYHSAVKLVSSRSNAVDEVLTIQRCAQAYPEYVITFTQRRIIKARRAPRNPSQ